MAGGKETPRQKMIGMMYLVLTALLALNVSKDILNAFVIVEESMVTTNENFTKKVENLYTEFSKELVFNKEKVQPYYDKALKVKKASEDMVQMIKDIKKSGINPMIIQHIKELEKKEKVDKFITKDIVISIQM